MVQPSVSCIDLRPGFAAACTIIWATNMAVAHIRHDVGFFALSWACAAISGLAWLTVKEA